MILRILFFTVAFIIVSTGAAQNPLAIDLIEARGSGCPEGSYSFAATSDGSVVSVLFSKFTAQASPQVDSRSKSNCNIILRLRLLQGYGVGIVNSDYRGFVSLIGPNASAQFRSAWVLRDKGPKVAIGPVLEQNFTSPMSEEFFVRNPSPQIQWLGCTDRQARLILQTEVMAVGRKGSEAMISVDSSDMTAEMKFFLSFKPCGK